MGIACPMINNTHQSVTVLKPRVNLHWRVLITRSPQFTLGFTLGVVFSVGLDKCMTSIHHYDTVQSIFVELFCFSFFLTPSCHACMLSHFSCVWLCNPMDCTRQAPLSTGFPRQEYWSGLPFSPPGDLPNPGMEPASLMSPTLAGRQALYH